ncbi:MAG: hypothetical protein WA294_17830 [Acidobacteriaceae bacterium]
MKRSRIKGAIVALAFSIPALSIALVVSEGQAAPGAAAEQGKAAPPIVRITAPGNNTAYNWNSLVSYSVVVTYQGKSTEYQEIPSNQVLITTTYIPDLSKQAQAAPAAEPVPDGLLGIVRSNCVGCHEFKAKAMGPSFAAIAAHYPDNPATIDTLSRHIREGSAGLWVHIWTRPLLHGFFSSGVEERLRAYIRPRS